ncbi:hypothetical protein THRCLA_05189 [Thraustotheca clavata]|uniref:Tyrosine specific protein phosphatases domain-containing protein n=1 Tax=Thraustotheca clavata TaxID=74557 RepID=A0A1V9ZWP2_9STRA|nr:hypothetical protein THRCLA_05189 [Thraustotheca clavata]
MSKEHLINVKTQREEHLKLVFERLQSLVPVYEEAIQVLEKHVASNRTPDGVEQWFLLYLRIVDLSVEIRRGEIRHQHSEKIKYKSQTKTCHATALTNGLGIDDANALMNQLEKIYRQLKKRKPLQLDTLESNFDILDRDDIGPLDKRLFECKRSMESMRSSYYTSCSITVHGDLHVELVIMDGSQIILQKRRVCTSVEDCQCPIDAKPWKNFEIIQTISRAKKDPPKTTRVNEDEATYSLNDLKKSYGVDVDERERNSEAFQNEVLGINVIEQVPSVEPKAKRRCLPLQQAIQKECATEYSSALVQAILMAIKPQAPTNNSTTIPCHINFSAIEWGAHETSSKVKTVVNIATSANLHFAKWIMNDIKLPKEDVQALEHHLGSTPSFQTMSELSMRCLLTPPILFGDLLSQIGTLSGLEALDLSYNTLTNYGIQLETIMKQCAHLRSLNLEQCNLKGIESHLLHGLEACQDKLKTLVLADNVFHGDFLSNFFQMLSSMNLETLDLRYVSTANSSSISFHHLSRLQTLHLDYSSLLQNTSFLGSLNTSLIDENCILSHLTLQCTYPSDLNELLNHIAHYGQLEHLSLTGIRPLPSLDLVLRVGLYKCVHLDLSLDPSAFPAFRLLLSPTSVPCLQSLRIQRMKRDRSMEPPEHWDDVAKMGSVLSLPRGGNIVCARVPLDDKFSVPRGQEWTPLQLLESCLDQGLSVHLVIDLTNTFKYYNGQDEFERRNVEYVKLKVEGFADVPSEMIIQRFFKTIDCWQRDLRSCSPSKLKPVAIVHCTHGLNRTGYLIVRYLIEKMNLSVKNALDTFTKTRSPGLIKHMYVTKLFEKFNQMDQLELPVLPAWAEKKYDRSQKELAKADKFKRTEDDRDARELVQDAKFTAPKNWIDVLKCGESIDRFVPMRTPLNDSYTVAPTESWTPRNVLESQMDAGRSIEMVIDLTKNHNYYNGDEDFPAEIEYVKIDVEASSRSPNAEVVEEFIKVVDNFYSSKNGYIAIHCTLGLDYTGCLIVQYLVQRRNYSFLDAFTAFQKARSPGIIRYQFVHDLYQQYAPMDTIVYPNLPKWAYKKFFKRIHNNQAEKVVGSESNLFDLPLGWEELPKIGASMSVHTSGGQVHLIPMKTLIDNRYTQPESHSWTPHDFSSYVETNSIDAIISINAQGRYYNPFDIIPAMPYFEVLLRSKQHPNPSLIQSFYDSIAKIQKTKGYGQDVSIAIHCTNGGRAAFFILHYIMEHSSMPLDDVIEKYQKSFPPGPLATNLNRVLSRKYNKKPRDQA